MQAMGCLRWNSVAAFCDRYALEREQAPSPQGARHCIVLLADVGDSFGQQIQASCINPRHISPARAHHVHTVMLA